MPSFQDISSILNHFVGVWFNDHVRFSLGDGQPGRNGVCTTAYSQAFCRTSSSPAGRCWPGSGWRRWRKVCDSLKSDLCFFLLLKSYKILHISKIIQTCSCQLAFFLILVNRCAVLRLPGFDMRTCHRSNSLSSPQQNPIVSFAPLGEKMRIFVRDLHC